MRTKAAIVTHLRLPCVIALIRLPMPDCFFFPVLATDFLLVELVFVATELFGFFAGFLAEAIMISLPVYFYCLTYIITLIVLRQLPYAMI